MGDRWRVVGRVDDYYYSHFKDNLLTDVKLQLVFLEIFMNINLIRVTSCKICVGMVVNSHEQARVWKGVGWEFIIRKFFTQFKKTAVYQNRRKNIKIKKNNDRFNKHIYTCITLEHVTRAFWIYTNWCVSASWKIILTEQSQLILLWFMTLLFRERECKCFSLHCIYFSWGFEWPKRNDGKMSSYNVALYI